ncbi:MAG: hypothetical protein ICV74_00795 [Thermoleophilia bacterium]|nr:hypothetical protein [Thermoleophilia bacterium]
MTRTLLDLLLPFAAVTLLSLAAVAFMLYVWTWVRYVASPHRLERATQPEPLPRAGYAAP